MSQQEQEHNSSLPYRHIIEAVQRARKACNRYDYAVHDRATRGINPEHDSDVQDAHVTMHSAVMDAFRALRSPIKKNLEEYWQSEEIVEGLNGLSSLDEYTGGYQIQVVEDTSRHNKPQRSQQVEPVILPPQACKNATNLLGEAMDELGLGASVKKDRPRWGFIEVEEGEDSDETPGAEV